MKLFLLPGAVASCGSALCFDVLTAEAQSRSSVMERRLSTGRTRRSAFARRKPVRCATCAPASVMTKVARLFSFLLHFITSSSLRWLAARRHEHRHLVGGLPAPVPARAAPGPGRDTLTPLATGMSPRPMGVTARAPAQRRSSRCLVRRHHLLAADRFRRTRANRPTFDHRHAPARCGIWQGHGLTSAEGPPGGCLAPRALILTGAIRCSTCLRRRRP